MALRVLEGLLRNPATDTAILPTILGKVRARGVRAAVLAPAIHQLIGQHDGPIRWAAKWTLKAITGKKAAEATGDMP